MIWKDIQLSFQGEMRMLLEEAIRLKFYYRLAGAKQSGARATEAA
jgi:hypothetical protein